MVKIIIPFTLIALSASFVLAGAPEVVSPREASENDLLARESNAGILEGRDVSKTIFSREDNVLEEREPFAFLARVIGRIASRAARHHVGNNNNNRRRRDLEAEDEVDFASREDGDELAERDLDMVEREMGDEDIVDREVDEDWYLD